MTDDRRPRTPPGDLPAFPSESSNLIPGKNGMSKREHFAVLICSGLMANPDYADKSGYELIDWAVEYADRLIAKLAAADRGDA
jgi:hypothetical protein